MNEKLQKIIQRINQLRAISKSTHSKAEAETTLQIASQLMAQYQLDEATVEAETGKINDPIDLDSEHIIYESGRISQWKSELASGIANLNGLFIYNAIVRGGISHRKQSRYRIIGKASNIQIALYMWEYLLGEITNLAADYVPGKIGQRGVNSERESWCLGCVRGFLAKMKAERETVMKSASSTALVFIGNQAEEAKKAFLNKTGMVLGRSTYHSKAQRDADTFNSGYRKGQTLSVNQGLGGGSGTAPKRLT